MQRTLLAVAALVAFALADSSEDYLYTKNYHTWCGPYAGSYWGAMISTFKECKHAAKLFGIKNTLLAGNEWHAGCLFQPNGNAYFVELTQDGTHAHAPQRHEPMGGYLCKRFGEADTYALNPPTAGCEAGLRIENEEQCSTVASGVWGFNYQHAVPTEHWQDGCIVNNDHAYWTPPSADGSEVFTHGYHNHGTICHQQHKDCAGVRGGNAVVDECGVCDGKNAGMDACGICGGDGMSCADPCADKVNTGKGDYCEKFDAIIKKGDPTRVGHKKRNFCKGVYGRFCPKNCCTYENE